MVEILIAGIIGFLASIITVKLWKEVLVLLEFILTIPLYLVEFFSNWPFMLFNSCYIRLASEKKLARLYDKVFFEAASRKSIKRINKRISRLNLALFEQHFREMRKKQKKEIVKMLNEAKWVL